jgi:anion-transporting  ArsA/GET3 family ATPase
VSEAGRGGVANLAAERGVVVCAGPGGVGKTTVSAAIALQAARLGRQACVITVDPARRLADALGVAALSNVPAEVEGDFAGSLHALMLDTKGTFDDLVTRYARSDAQAEAIQQNRIYRDLTGMLSGTQEYMAMEKLYELTESGLFDIVVVDTPPTRNALDLLDAPRRLTRFLDNRLFRALLAPTRASLRVVSLATRALLRTISKVAGAEIVEDAVDFFQAFEGMEQGFSDRAAAVRELLADPSTAYVLITSPRPDSIEETAYFAAKLGETEVEAAALVVNRVHPAFAPVAVRPDAVEGPLRGILANHDRLARSVSEENRALSTLFDQLPDCPVARVALLATDVHDLDGLATMADLLFGSAPVG